MIEIKKLTKKFQNETEIKYKNIKFETGKSYMLLGSSGCGKSTLLNMIAGVISPTSGSIFINGENMTEKSQKEKDKFRIKDIGYIFQDFKLLDNMSVLDNINILKLEKINTSNIDEILSDLDILDKKNSKIKHLSGGQKQRVAIARAIIKKPQIILADEPTGNLNFSIGEQVIKKLIEVIDNFDRGLKAIETVEDCEKVKECYQLAYKNFNDVLGKIGLETIPAEGEVFDPNLHEAVMQTPTDENPENTIIAELQKGYKLGDKVLRASLVNVATAP